VEYRSDFKKTEETPIETDVLADTAMFTREPEMAGEMVEELQAANF
jgi:hypothetical protein